MSENCVDVEIGQILARGWLPRIRSNVADDKLRELGPPTVCWSALAVASRWHHLEFRERHGVRVARTPVRAPTKPV